MMDREQGSSFTGSEETAALVVEIGCEEIPGRFLADAEYELGQRLAAALQDARLLVGNGPAKTGSTPRRLVAYVPAVLKRQPDRIHQVLGPSVKTAFDQQGAPARAAEAFAAKHHVQVSDLSRIRNAKGEYLAAELREDGSKAVEVLRDLLPNVIGGLSFPKSMYWTAKGGPRFVRPIRWILALLGEADEVQVVHFEFAGVHSGAYTFGHRLRGSQPLEVKDLNLDLMLEERWVVLQAADRRQRIQQQIKALLEKKHLTAPRDEFLEDWVVNSTEWPTALMGSFESRYLDLPREVLVTVMRGHQKYFAVENKSGSLRPHFITVLNVPGDPKGLIREGHERVLGARFADAEFFWKADQRIPLTDRIPMLEGVLYHEKLGTYGDKVRRMRKLAEEICSDLERSKALNAQVQQHALRAVELCKCDLTTQMVQEFTELQGIIGGLYAKVQGEAPEVGEAIYDHYKPVSVEDSCPRSVVGDVVSLADKLDSVTAGFAAGLEPTGSSDPFALRRAGNGIIKLAIEALPKNFDLATVFNRFLDARQFIFGVKTATDGEREPLQRRVDGFLRERLEFYLRDVAGIRYDTARAVLGSTNVLQLQDQATASRTWTAVVSRMFRQNTLSNALSRAKALDRVRDTEDFLALAAAAKRTRNIRKSASEADLVGGEPDRERFTEGPEHELYEGYKSLRGTIEMDADAGDFEGAFRAMASIRPQVDLFFDKVLVMVEDSAVRRNRLMLLLRLNEDVFTSLADLAEIAVEPRSGTATMAQ